jgi:hypothetical protein
MTICGHKRGAVAQPSRFLNGRWLSFSTNYRDRLPGAPSRATFAYIMMLSLGTESVPHVTQVRFVCKSPANRKELVL